MPEQFSSHSVTVERQRLRFAAGHFATFADELEPIHGHNYDVFVEVVGPANGGVVGDRFLAAQAVDA